MSHVLVSYKREDEMRVARLVSALETNGLKVWWDKSLPVGGAWREGIQAALDQAGCVVVVWSHASTGPDGGFVRDEATRAKARGVLVPVRIDDVDPPLGFGEVQALDLRGWKGAPKDPRIRDLAEACRARLEGRPPAAAGGAAQALMRRVRNGSIAAAAAAALWGFVSNVNGVQNRVCALPVGQPAVSDACGAVGLGHRPNRAERLAWAARRPGSCEDLRTHMQRFPDGAYRTEAAELLAGAQTTRAAAFSPDPRPLRGYVRQSAHGFASEGAAKADALVRARTDALSLCAPTDAYGRLDGADVAPGAYDCRPGFEGIVCGLDYAATCRIETRALTEHCG